MALVEGIGDEVLIFVGILAILAVVLFAWASTSVRPLFNNGSVWMVHMQTAPERRVLEVYSLDESATPSRQMASRMTTVPATSSVDSPNLANGMETTISNTTTSITEESDDNSDQSQSLQEPVVDHSTSGGEETSESPRRRIVVTDSTNGETSGQGSLDRTSEMQATSSADTTTIKLKFLDDTQKLVATWLSQTVGEFKRQHFETDVNEGRVVRLIYRGQLLRDDSRSLASYGLHDNCVLHCHVSSTPYEQHSGSGRQTNGGGDGVRTTPASGPNGSANGAGPGNGLDLGRYIYVIFAFNFAALWSAWFVFPEYFSRTSLVSLILCSGLFMLFWYGSQRRRPTMPVASNTSS